MLLSSEVHVFAAPDDHVSHLGPRPAPQEEGPLTLCGLYLDHMVRLSVEARKTRDACVVCESLAAGA